MKILLSILFLLLYALEGFSQPHAPLNSQYMFNGLAINPAYTGSRESFSTSLIYRNQWTGIEGAPVTQTFSAHTPLKKKNIALGLLMYNDKVAVTNQSGFFANYAYRIFLNKSVLSFGIKGGIDVLRSNWIDIETIEPDDPAFEQDQETTVLPNTGMGVYFYSKKYYIGASIPSMLSYKTGDSEQKLKPYNSIENYNFIFTGGFVFSLSDNIKSKPSILFKFIPSSKAQIDINNSFIFNDTFWVGISVRTQDALVLMFEYQINNQIKVGYAYDYSYSGLRKHNYGSHEILLRYEFVYKVKAFNPRYF